MIPEGEKYIINGIELSYEDLTNISIRVNERTRYRIYEDEELRDIQMRYIKLNAIRTWAFQIYLFVQKRDEEGRITTLADSLVKSIEDMWKEALEQYDRIYQKIYMEEFEKEIEVYKRGVQ